MTTTAVNPPKSALSRIIAAGTHQRVLAFASLVVLLIGFSIASPIEPCPIANTLPNASFPTFRPRWRVASTTGCRNAA